MSAKNILDLVLNNVAYAAIVWATIQEVLPWFIGCMGGAALAWYNVEKALKMRQERKKDEEL